MIISKYIASKSDVEKGWAWAEQHRKYQEVAVSASDNGYTLQVHRVLADPTQTTVFYTVMGENPGLINTNPRTFRLRFNNKSCFGGMSRRKGLIDGVTVGCFEIGPLPEEEGVLEFYVREIGSVKGRWDVKFPVTRVPLGLLTRYIPVNTDFDVPGGVLTVEQLVLAPTQTVVELRYRGSAPGPSLLGGPEFVKLFTPEGPVRMRGGEGGGGGSMEETREETHKLEFQRLDPVPAAVTLELAGRVFRREETRIFFAGDKNVRTPDGCKISVDNLDMEDGHGRVTLRFAEDGKIPETLDIIEWRILDDKGELCPIHPANCHSMVQLRVRPKEAVQETIRELEWLLPAGHKAVALVITGYWETVEVLAGITIQIPEVS